MTNRTSRRAPEQRTSSIVILGIVVFGLGLVAAGIAVIVSGIRTRAIGNVLGGSFMVLLGIVFGRFIQATGSTETQFDGDNSSQRTVDVDDLPIFRRRFAATSPNGMHSADMPVTNEAGMGNPMVGELHLSDGLVLEACSPCFVWSNASRYLAVPQMTFSPGWFGLFFTVRMLVIDTQERMIYRSKRFKEWLQPESFVMGRLVVCVNPWGPSRKAVWVLPYDLAAFKRFTYDQLGRTGPIQLPPGPLPGTSQSTERNEKIIRGELPVGRDRLKVMAPNGRQNASMVTPAKTAAGQALPSDLHLSDGLVLRKCGPRFLWSDDSRYLAVTHASGWPGLFGWLYSVRILVIDTQDRLIYASKRFGVWLEPESFADGQLVICVDPSGAASRTAWSIPAAIGEFRRFTYEQSAAPARR